MHFAQKNQYSKTNQAMNIIFAKKSEKDITLHKYEKINHVQCKYVFKIYGFVLSIDLKLLSKAKAKTT